MLRQNLAMNFFLDLLICINSAPDPINMLDFLVFSVCPSTEFPRSQFFLKIVLNFYIFFRELNFYMSMHLCIIYPLTFLDDFFTHILEPDLLGCRLQLHYCSAG